jgi:hypothetical protein
VAGHVTRLSLALTYVYFRRANHHRRALVTRATTETGGRFVTHVTARRTGGWFVFVPGTTENTSRWSQGIHVSVR